MSASPRESPVTPGALVALLPALVLLFVGWLAVRSLTPPAPIAASAPADVFSAERARAVLDRLLARLGGHPVGSPGNAQVRARIETELRSLGLSPSEQLSSICSGASCGTVINVLARLPATGPHADAAAPALLLLAHYDSVAAGPGYSDDGLGLAAILETLRVLTTVADRRADVIALFTDGEEAGLWGAKAFVNEHPWAKELGFVLNGDARGSSGPSLLFETGDDAALSIDLLRESGAHPVTSSLFPLVYEHMPNGTDFTPLRRRAVAGLNFAIIGSPWTYHSDHDDAQSFSNASLQDQGGAMTLVARRFAGAKPVPASTGVTREVYFSVLRLTVVAWPAGASLALALVALLGVATSAWRLRASMPMRARAVMLGALLPIASAVLVALLGVAALLAGDPDAMVAPLAVGSFVALGFATSIGVAKIASRGCTWTELWFGGALTWSVLGVLVAALAPAASYLFIVPALVFALLSAAIAARPSLGDVAALRTLPALAAVLLWLPLPALVADALGAPALPACAVVATLGSQPIASLMGAPFTRAITAALVLGHVVFAIAVARVSPSPSPSPSPERAGAHGLESSVPPDVTHALASTRPRVRAPFMTATSPGAIASVTLARQQWTIVRSLPTRGMNERRSGTRLSHLLRRDEPRRAVLDLALRSRVAQRMARRRKGRPQGRVPCTHQGHVDGHASSELAHVDAQPRPGRPRDLNAALAAPAPRHARHGRPYVDAAATRE